MRHVNSALTAVVAVITAAVLSLLIVASLTDSTVLWRAATYLGEEYVYVFLSIAALIYLSPEWGVLLLYSVVLSGGVDVALKYVLHLPRPPKALWRAEAEGPGFPSGHSEVSAGFWTEASLITHSKLIALLSSVVVLTVALSRVALMVHYPTDVLGGAAIGIALSLGLYTAWKYLPPKWWVTSAAIASISASWVGAVTSGLPVAYKLLGVSAGGWTYLYFKGRLEGLATRSVRRRTLAFLASLAVTAFLIAGGKLLQDLIGPAYALTLTYFLIPPSIYWVSARFSKGSLIPSQQ